MNIKYIDESKNHVVLSVNTENHSVIDVASFDLGSLRIQKQSFDLKGYQGTTARIYAENSGDLSDDRWRDHDWLLAEIKVPELTTKTVYTGEYGENGQEITQQELVQPDLTDAAALLYPIPGVVVNKEEK